ncbi:MAG: zinc-binding dehydrogenase [Cyanobacteria bacterium P01_H01_bin.162]
MTGGRENRAFPVVDWHRLRLGIASRSLMRSFQMTEITIWCFFLTPTSEFCIPNSAIADLARLFELLVKGKIKPAIAAQLPLTQARQAHEMIEHGDVLGKLVLLAADPAGKARSEP